MEKEETEKEKTKTYSRFITNNNLHLQNLFVLLF